MTCQIERIQGRIAVSHTALERRVLTRAELYLMGNPELQGLTCLRPPQQRASSCSRRSTAAEVATLIRLSTTPPRTIGVERSRTADIVGFNNHAPFELTVSPEAIAGGFYVRVNKLQRERDTWWQGRRAWRMAARLSGTGPNTSCCPRLWPHRHR